MATVVLTFTDIPQAKGVEVTIRGDKPGDRPTLAHLAASLAVDAVDAVTARAGRVETVQGPLGGIEI